MKVVEFHSSLSITFHLKGFTVFEKRPIRIVIVPVI